jgi:type IV secretory pathway VirB4 component
MPKISTQQFLEFGQIREGIVILKNKALRAILMVSSLNFALKSEKEQNATLYQFQNFLNSLDFSCQILMHSRRLNIVGYLDKLKEIGKKEENELLKMQIDEYQKFIEDIMAGGSIMQKIFYVIVPFTLMEAQAALVPQKKKKLPVRIPALTEEEFQRCKAQLLQRVEFIALGLSRCGLQAVPLATPEIIELFWSFYHPQETERGYSPEIPAELSQ